MADIKYKRRGTMIGQALEGEIKELAKTNPYYIELEEKKWLEDHPGEALPEEMKQRKLKAPKKVIEEESEG